MKCYALVRKVDGKCYALVGKVDGKCYALVRKVDGKEEILKTINPAGEVFEFKFKTFEEAEVFLKFSVMKETGVYIKEIDC